MIRLKKWSLNGFRILEDDWEDPLILGSWRRKTTEALVVDSALILCQWNQHCRQNGLQWDDLPRIDWYPYILMYKLWFRLQFCYCLVSYFPKIVCSILTVYYSLTKQMSWALCKWVGLYVGFSPMDLESLTCANGKKYCFLVFFNILDFFGYFFE